MNRSVSYSSGVTAWRVLLCGWVWVGTAKVSQDDDCMVLWEAKRQALCLVTLGEVEDQTMPLWMIMLSMKALVDVGWRELKGDACC